MSRVALHEKCMAGQAHRLAPQLVVDELARVHGYFPGNAVEASDRAVHQGVELRRTAGSEPRNVSRISLTVQLARQKGLLGVILFIKALTGLRISLLNRGTGS